MSLGEKLIRPSLKDLVPYESARRIGGNGDVWLNANENPYSSEFNLDCSRFNRYPEFQPAAVIDGYAEYTGLNADQVLCTRGADEGIELLIRTFCDPGKDKVLICPPTYGMYAISAETNAVEVVKVVVDEVFQPDVDAIKAQADGVKLVFLCSPNNPTGHLLERDRLLTLLDLFADKALVVVDEAYIEFAADTSMQDLLNDYPHLVILRTLSKAFGLAGLRCGFTLASADIIQQISKVIAPYPVPEPVAQVAAQALSTAGLERMASQVAELNGYKQHFVDALKALGADAWPSAGNFVMIKTQDPSACMKAAMDAGIILRDQSKQMKLDGCVRVTIGSQQEMERTLAALRVFLKEAA
ncbi:histidinol-phosphate transaminase [Corallincola spongiicola]|uniref:Histidinol-phosphate aminotransferase n=1 Tax=Corallincola spongiicola TaxID=2520508 RepID=A0ABY1WV51_9GAMM|nr:histidinol-phosphate transaminase [Corallincola spongiicola]TAA48618.1 histidinol-phosphate transaminase [Corallincola spongiicola]